MSDITGVSTTLTPSITSSNTTGQQTSSTDSSSTDTSSQASSSAAYALSGNLPSLMQLTNQGIIDTQLLQSLSSTSDVSFYNTLESYNFYNLLNPDELQALQSVAKGQLPTTTTDPSTTSQTPSTNTATTQQSSDTSTGSNIDMSA